MQQMSVLNPDFVVKEEPVAANHSLVVIEPLEKGYGNTLGNSLRRVLLSSISGAAFTKVRVSGVDHQFSVVKGVTEDILDITLNLKSIRLRSVGSGPWIARLQAKGPGKITAADLECEAGLEVINQDQHIATLDKKGTLELELTAEQGIGYTQAVDGKTNTIGDVSLDALFSPIIIVSYKVEATRVGRRTDFDKLVLDVVTNGSITPLAAVQQSAKILAQQFSQIVEPIVHIEPEKEEKLSPEEQEVLRLTVEELDLPTRIANALRKGGFKTVADLKGAPRSVVVKVKNLGEKSIDIVQKALDQKDIKLGE